jgi:DNA polymerase III subunit alpha
MEIVGFENLHLHSDFSLLDGYGQVEEYSARAKQINQQFLCVTDHGMMGAIPRQIRACEEHGLEPLHGIELYVNPRQPEINAGQTMSEYVKQLNEEEKAGIKKSYHLLAIAYNETGYKNLVKMSSWGWLKGFYYKPRINHEVLMKYKEGIIFSSCCYMGEIGQAFERGGSAHAEEMLKKYIEMFAPNFYLEFMLLDFKKQPPYNRFIMEMQHKYGLPSIVTGDCHYSKPEDANMQRLMLMTQTKTTVAEIQKKIDAGETEELFELQDTNLWMKSEEELNDKWEKDYKEIIPYDEFKQAKINTVEICRRAKGVKLDKSNKLPAIPDANEKLKDAMIEGFKRRNLPKTQQYMDRLKEEYDLICSKDFASYFLIQKLMTDEARRIAPILLGWGSGREAVGPGRGSVCGSLICYCLAITDIDPVKHDLLFSRFLSPVRGGKTMKTRFSTSPIQVNK